MNATRGVPLRPLPSVPVFVTIDQAEQQARGFRPEAVENSTLGGAIIARVSEQPAPTVPNQVLPLAAVKHTGWLQLSVTIESGDSTGGLILGLVHALNLAFADPVFVGALVVDDLGTSRRHFMLTPRLWLPDGYARIQVRSFTGFVPGAAPATIDVLAVSLPDVIAAAP